MIVERPHPGGLPEIREQISLAVTQQALCIRGASLPGTGFRYGWATAARRRSRGYAAGRAVRDGASTGVGAEPPGPPLEALDNHDYTVLYYVT